MRIRTKEYTKSFRVEKEIDKYLDEISFKLGITITDYIKNLIIQDRSQRG